MNAARAFTLIELLIVVAIVAILAAIAIVNMREATLRAERSACAANLKTIATALMMYRVDYNHYPLSDGVAGTGDTRNQTQFGNGPAGNGYWNGIPNVLVALKYVGDRKALFCPTLSKRHANRHEYLRYAYNTGAQDSNGFVGAGGTPIDGVGAGGNTWLCRCLQVNSSSFAPDRYLPFPHGADPDPTANPPTWGSENVLRSDGGVEFLPGKGP